MSNNSEESNNKNTLKFGSSKLKINGVKPATSKSFGGASSNVKVEVKKKRFSISHVVVRYITLSYTLYT